MARGVTKTDLESEWRSLQKNWYSIYQCKPTSRAGYLEWIAEWITASFSLIQLNTSGLRTRSFKVAEHRGQIGLRTGIEQLTEKRIVRAMFNLSQLPLVGEVIDYEVPLKETDEADHGDNDLLCVAPNVCLCIEAKKPDANESILKAVLQAFVYTSLVSTKKQAFLTDFSLDQKLQLTPGILTFAAAKSGRQLEKMDGYPQLRDLIRMLNFRLANNGIAPLRFFVVENPIEEFATCLTTTNEANGDIKAVFSSRFTLSIVEKFVS